MRCSDTMAIQLSGGGYDEMGVRRPRSFGGGYAPVVVHAPDLYCFTRQVPQDVFTTRGGGISFLRPKGLFS